MELPKGKISGSLDENVIYFVKEIYPSLKGKSVLVEYNNMGTETIHQGIFLSSSPFSIYLGLENYRTHSLSFGEIDEISNRADYIKRIFVRNEGKLECVYYSINNHLEDKIKQKIENKHKQDSKNNLTKHI